MAKIFTINDLPSIKLPDFWQDDARMNSLYAPFRDRSVNARDWDSKLFFWKSLISTWTHYNKICAFTEADIKKYFIKNDRVPACINVVLNEMHKDQDLVTIEKFMEEPQKTWTGWAIDLTIKKPLKWSFNKVKNTLIAPINVNTKFVHMQTIKNLSEELLKSVPEECTNKLLTLNELIPQTNFKEMNFETIQLIVHYLKCQDKIDMIQDSNLANDSDEENPILIKFSIPNTTKVTPISEIDIAKYKLETNEKLLLKKLEKLEQEKTEATKNAKMYVAKGMRQMAKTCLRKQHELEKRIEKQVNVLENVQTLLLRIGSAESDSNVLESYKSGLSALKFVFKENGLTEDGVSNTMLEMTDTLEEHDEIQATLSQTISSISDADLEDELLELLNEPEQPPTHPSSPHGGNKTSEDESCEDDLERRLKNLLLPSVPTETPTSSPIRNMEFS